METMIAYHGGVPIVYKSVSLCVAGWTLGLKTCIPCVCVCAKLHIVLKLFVASMYPSFTYSGMCSL